jgi:hypothetical protein
MPAGGAARLPARALAPLATISRWCSSTIGDAAPIRVAEETTVFARVSPAAAQKYRIVRALKARRPRRRLPRWFVGSLTAQTLVLFVIRTA